MAEINSADLRQQFASDNFSGICPEAWAAMAAANRGHALLTETTPGLQPRRMPSGSCLRPSARSFLPSMARRQTLWRSPRFASRITPSSAVKLPM